MRSNSLVAPRLRPLAATQGVGLLVMRIDGVFEVPRSRWTPGVFHRPRTALGSVFCGLQIDIGGKVAPINDSMVEVLPEQWRLLLAGGRHLVPTGAILDSGLLSWDQAYVDYDANVLEWVCAWAARCARADLADLTRKPPWTLTDQPPHEGAAGRRRGRQRAEISLRP